MCVCTITSLLLLLIVRESTTEPKSACLISKRDQALSSKTFWCYLILTALATQLNLTCHCKSYRENKLLLIGERFGTACSLSSSDILLSKFLPDFLLMSEKLIERLFHKTLCGLLTRENQGTYAQNKMESSK